MTNYANFLGFFLILFTFVEYYIIYNVCTYVKTDQIKEESFKVSRVQNALEYFSYIDIIILNNTNR